MEPTGAFRIHRHDVLNSLQLVRAYIQLDRVDRALSAVTDLSAWLQSLSLAQAVFAESAESLLWTASACSRARLAEVVDAPRWTPTLRRDVGQVWITVNDQVALIGADAVKLRLRGTGETAPAILVRIEVAAGKPENEQLREALQTMLDNGTLYDLAEAQIGIEIDTEED